MSGSERMTSGTILYGGCDVPLERRSWKAGPRIPYRKTYALKPGQRWDDAEVTDKQWEHYVLLADGSQIPVGALIARNFLAYGAEWAGFTEMWHGVVFVGVDLVCVEPPSAVADFIDRMRNALGTLRGLPDAIGVFPDGRIRASGSEECGSQGSAPGQSTPVCRGRPGAFR